MPGTNKGIFMKQNIHEKQLTQNIYEMLDRKNIHEQQLAQKIHK
jgi:hypothetical protein